MSSMTMGTGGDRLTDFTVRIVGECSPPLKGEFMKKHGEETAIQTGYWNNLSQSLGRQAHVFDDEDALILLKAALEREGSQAAFANRVGVHRSYISMVLNGRQDMSHANAIVKALGLRKVYVVK
jgi:Helix-turn-helix